MQRLLYYANGVGPARVYEGDSCQNGRVMLAREMLARYCPGVVVDLGCGSGDISGVVGEKACGFDANEDALKIARGRFPLGSWSNGIPNPFECGTVVLCEVLEHMDDPIRVVSSWLPMAQYSLISHPLDEELHSTMAGGEHQWSFSEPDFENWFKLGGHELIEKTRFQMGGYTGIMGAGRKS